MPLPLPEYSIPPKEEVAEAIMRIVKQDAWGGMLAGRLGDSRYWNLPPDYASAVVDWMIVRLHQADTGEIIRRLDDILAELELIFGRRRLIETAPEE